MQSHFPVYFADLNTVVDVLKVELEADAIAAAFLKVTQGMTPREYAVILTAYARLGGFDFNNVKFHGYPSDRKWAAQIGMNAVEEWGQVSLAALTNIHERIFVRFRPQPLAPSIRAVQRARIQTMKGIEVLSGVIDSRTSQAKTNLLSLIDEISIYSTSLERMAMLDAAAADPAVAEALTSFDQSTVAAFHTLKISEEENGLTLDSRRTIAAYLSNASNALASVRPHAEAWTQVANPTIVTVASDIAFPLDNAHYVSIDTNTSDGLRLKVSNVTAARKPRAVWDGILTSGESGVFVDNGKEFRVRLEGVSDANNSAVISAESRSLFKDSGAVGAPASRR